MGSERYRPCLSSPSRVTILPVCDAPTKTSLLNPCSRVGRHMPRFSSGFSDSVRQWSLFSSDSSWWRICSSLSWLRGRIATGKGPTDAQSSNLIFQGLRKLTRSSTRPPDCISVLLPGLSFLTRSHSLSHVAASVCLAVILLARIQESRSKSSLTPSCPSTPPPPAAA